MEISREYKLKLLKKILYYSKRKGDCLICYIGWGKNGRPRVNFQGKNYYAYRIIMHLLADIPLNSELHVLHNDSICTSKKCIEFDHLRMGTNEENFQEAVAKHGRFLKRQLKDFCIRGHARIPENMYTDRSCRLCQDVYNKRRYPDKA